MRKNLEEMSPAELGRLFPIIITAYNEEWPGYYQAEEKRLQAGIGPANIVKMEHYGSTSIPGMYAKPTIDILLEVKAGTDLDELINKFRSMGYYYSHQPDDPPPHMMFMKGYSPGGYQGQAYHVHVRYKGDWDELYFRDFLIMHPEIAAEYGRLKLGLQAEYKYDREGYTRGKSEFISKVTSKARKESGSGLEP